MRNDLVSGRRLVQHGLVRTTVSVDAGRQEPHLEELQWNEAGHVREECGISPRPTVRLMALRVRRSRSCFLFLVFLRLRPLFLFSLFLYDYDYWSVTRQRLRRSRFDVSSNDSIPKICRRSNLFLFMPRHSTTTYARFFFAYLLARSSFI